MSDGTAGDNRYTSGIAEFVAGLRYDAIPAEVRQRIKLLILDSLGCAIFGTELEWSRLLMTTLASVDTSTGNWRWMVIACSPCTTRTQSMPVSGSFTQNPG